MKKIFMLLLGVGLILIIGIRFATPISQPKPNPKEILESWTVMDSKSYAQDKLYEWQHKQWSCLDNLWSKESNWRPSAYNKVKIMGKNAGGIPQLLGLDPKTPAPKQIDRGLDYIYNRYHTPCQAWKFFIKKGYY